MKVSAIIKNQKIDKFDYKTVGENDRKLAKIVILCFIIEIILSWGFLLISKNQYSVNVLLLRVRLSRAHRNVKHVLVISFRARAEVVGGGGSVNL